jgi:UDP-glucose 4-epimerase
LNYEIAGRREGDVIAIYADYTKAQKLLGWTPRRDLDEIMRSAWHWEVERSR